jgi:hypothetical protein
MAFQGKESFANNDGIVAAIGDRLKFKDIILRAETTAYGNQHNINPTRKNLIELFL